MRARTFILCWAVGGLVVPLLMLLSSSGGGGIFAVAPRVATALWPFSLGLMALGPSVTGAIVMIAVTLLLNVKAFIRRASRMADKTSWTKPLPALDVGGF